MSHEEDGAAKLLLAIVFSQVYEYLGTEIWTTIRTTATEILFELVGAPDSYIFTLENIKNCNSIAIRSAAYPYSSARVEIRKNGDFKWLNAMTGRVKNSQVIGHLTLLEVRMF